MGQNQNVSLLAQNLRFKRKQCDSDQTEADENGGVEVIDNTLSNTGVVLWKYEHPNLLSPCLKLFSK
jgi:hypothetical protein